jgi:hypothetical protein
MADNQRFVGNDVELPFRPTLHRQAIQEWLVDGANTPEQNRVLSELDHRNRPWFSIVLSHRQRHPEQLVELRTAVEEILKEGHRLGATLVASPETPLGPYLIQAAKRLGVLVKPLISPSCGVLQAESVPWIDRALIAIPDRVYVLEVRTESKTFELLYRRLNDDRFRKGSVFLDAERSIDANQSRSTQEDAKRTAAWDALLQCGAVFRLRYRTERDHDQRNPFLETDREMRPGPSSEIAVQPQVPILFKLPRALDYDEDTEGYLTHCTRAPSGPWPDQSPIGYLENLIGMQDAQTSPMDTLVRILSQQRLLATDHLKRGQHPSVSFAKVPLLELLSRRRFRSHLGRWDWEPYGLCIHARTLERLGGRPVIYGDKVQWTQLPVEDQPFFQTVIGNQTKHSENDHKSSWETEREWRILGDIHLTLIPFSEAFVFVPSMQEAIHLQHLSRFPVLCLERLLTS